MKRKINLITEGIKGKRSIVGLYGVSSGVYALQPNKYCCDIGLDFKWLPFPTVSDNRKRVVLKSISCCI